MSPHSSSPVSAITPSTTHIVCGQLFNGKSPVLLSNQVIIISDGVISATVPRTECVLPESPDSVVDLSNYTVLPGLVDPHVHVESGAETDTAIFNDSIAKRALQASDNVRRALHTGVTSMRVLGTHNFIDLALRDCINDGLIMGPRLQGAGYLIAMTGGHGMALECHSCDLPPSIYEFFGGVADGTVEMRKVVRFSIRQGVDCIKLSATGGTLSQGATVGSQQYEEEEIRAAVIEARKAGIPVAVHAHGLDGIKAALAAGAASIEHGSFCDEETLQYMSKHGVYLCPTLYNLNVDLFRMARRLGLRPHVRIRTAQVSESLNRVFRRALELGVKILPGSDSTYIAGRFGIVTELEWFVKLGMSPSQALIGATSLAAEAMAWTGKVGEISVGAYADIIAVSGNPLNDISCLHDTRFVMKGGAIVRDHPRSTEELNAAYALADATP